VKKTVTKHEQWEAGLCAMLHGTLMRCRQGKADELLVKYKAIEFLLIFFVLIDSIDQLLD